MTDTAASAAQRPARIHLFGPGRHAFAEALQGAVHQALGLAPGAALPLEFSSDGLPHEALAGDLCWLLAWEADEQVSATADLAALQAHQGLRQTLHQHGLSYQVLRGTPEERLAHALQSLASRLPALIPHLPRTGVSSRRPGALRCERCGDPDCERQSFSRLIEDRRSQEAGCSPY